MPTGPLWWSTCSKVSTIRSGVSATTRTETATSPPWSTTGQVTVARSCSSSTTRVEDESPLDPGTPGNQLKPYLKADPDLAVSKTVNSAFHGTPDLHAWLVDRKAAGIVVCGITTNHCCDTTARVGGNLGHDVLFALDATYTFDRTGPDGHTLTADELARATATNLHGEFATVTSTAELLAGTARPLD